MKTTTFFAGLLVSTGVFAQTIQEGITALEFDKLNKATAVFTSLIKAQPTNSEAYYYLGNTYIEKEKLDSAKICYTKAVSVNSQSPYGYIGLGKLLLDEKKLAEAKTNFDKALTITKEKDIVVLRLVAESYAQGSGRDSKKAVEIANKALVLDKKNADTYVTLGDIYLAENNGGLAVNNYENATSFAPANPKAYARIGKVFSQSRNFSVAQENFNKAIEKDANYAPAYRDLGELYYRAKKYDKAKETYKKYLELSETNTATLTRYAYMLFLAKDYTEATNVITQISVLDSSNIILKRLLGYSYYEQNKPKEGLKSLQLFFQQADPSRLLPSDYEYLGKLYAKNGKDSLAIENLKIAMAQDTTKPELYYDLGDTYYRAKKYDKAAEAYQNKINKAKNYTAADYFGLGRSFYFSKQYGKADTAFSKLLEMKADYALGYLYRGKSNNINPEKDYAKAQPFYEKYVELAANDPKASKRDLTEAYSFLAYCAIQKDDKVKAKEFYQKVLTVDPENKQAKELVNKL